MFCSRGESLIQYEGSQRQLNIPNNIDHQMNRNDDSTAFTVRKNQLEGLKKIQNNGNFYSWILSVYRLLKFEGIGLFTKPPSRVDNVTP